MKKKEIIPKEKEPAASYDKLKIFEGHYYKGMKVGGRHKWNYEPGEWKETKRTPDLWQFNYAVKKRRVGKAPIGSGVPVGTEYQWAILASQVVRKIDANTYETEMHGLKFKVAYKKADKTSWSAGVKGQRKRLIQFLKSTLDLLEKEEIEANVKKKKITKKRKNSTKTNAL